MNLLIFLLVTILLSLLQNAFLPLNFLLVLVIREGLSSKDFLLKSLLAGFLFDLIAGLRLGVSSTAFLLISFLGYLYSRKFSKFHFFFLLGILFISILIFNSLVKGKLFSRLDGVLLLLFVGFSFLKKWSGSKDFEIKLRV